MIIPTKLTSALILSALASFATATSSFAQTLEGHAGENVQGVSESASYPAPQMMKAAPKAIMQKMPPPQHAIQAKATQNAPLQIGATKSITLPAGFMGRWTVTGSRKSVEAPQEFKAGAENAFAMQTTNTWNITGDAQRGYVIESDSGINTPMYVDKVGPGTAIIRYKHPVKNTQAEESVILQGGGNAFDGLERIAIVKPGQPPRAKVEYTLHGSR